MSKGTNKNIKLLGGLILLTLCMPSLLHAQGSWTSPVATGVDAIHMGLLPPAGGNPYRVIVHSYKDSFSGNTPRTGVFEPSNLLGGLNLATPADHFCSSHSSLPDGKFLFVDGETANNEGSPAGAGKMNRFNPANNSFENAGNTASPDIRWYPSTIVLGNGLVLTMGGVTHGGGNENDFAQGDRSLEYYDPVSNTNTCLSGCSNVMPWQDANAYPRIFLLEDNSATNQFKIFMAGAHSLSYFFTVNTDSNTASVVNGPNDNNTPSGGGDAGRLQGTYARLDDGRVLSIGGSNFNETGGTGSASIIDPDAVSPSWSNLPTLSFSRANVLSTVLADGKLMVYGGDDDCCGDRLTPELFDPSSNNWSNLATMPASQIRNYHTSGVLLPDGRVCVSGGAGNGGPGVDGESDQVNFYSPAYLSAGARPTINSAPSSASYGQNIAINYSSSSPITMAKIRRPGSSTHGFTYNMVGHTLFTGSDNDGTLNVTIPSNPNLAPPGYYLLFLFRDSGGEKVPSIATWIQIDGSGPPPDTDPPTPNPGTFSSPPSADSESAISMTATAGNDASPPVEYDFDETTGNTGGSDSPWTTNNNYTDSGLNPSTQYCYRTRSRDSLGNTGSWGTASCATTNAAPDTDPPTPNPATFSTPPTAIGDAVIIMIADFASDATPPIEYNFDETSGNPGATDSGWQTSTAYEDFELTGGNQYCYVLRSRDSLGNTTSPAAPACATTAPEDGFVDVTVGPGLTMTPQNITIPVGTTVEWTFIASGHNVWSGVTGGHTVFDGQAPWPAGTMLFASTADPVVTNAENTSFSATFDQAFLDASTGDLGIDAYNYHCHLHGSGIHDGSITITGGVDNDPPTPNPMTFASNPNATSSTTITMTASTATDEQNNPVEYFFNELTGNPGGSDSTWQSSTAYTDTGLAPLTQYSYTVAARDSVGNTTVVSATESATTPDTPPPSQISLETGVVSGISSSWTTVNLSSSYTSMVVVATPNYSSSSAPGTVRIQNASGSSFQVRLDGSSATPAASDIYYMVVEEGVYTQAQDGVTMEAVKYNSTLTDNNNSWTGQARTYANSYTSPVVLGQVMTYNDAGHVEFWSRGSTRQSIPSSSALFTGKTVNEDPDNAHANETIGYIVIESGSGTMDGVNYSAAVGGDTIRGVTNTPPYSYSVSGLSGTASIGIATMAAVDGGNGGWALFYGSNPISASSINLAIDEDQLADTERNHTTEQVAYIVFEDGTGGDTTPPTPNPATFSSAPTATSNSAISMTATTASDPSTPVEYQFVETSGNPGGSNSGWQTSTNYSDTGLNASTQYCYTVQSRDSVGNTGSASSASCATTQAGADTTPPTPNPATFASAPAATSSTTIAMTATTGSDPSGPVEYFFTELSGNPGGSNSAWQTSTGYSDSLLTPSTQYCYTVTMRDSVGNVGSASSSSCATTQTPPDTTPPAPNPATFATAPNASSSSQIDMVATTGSDPSGPVEYQFDETTGGAGATDSGWQTSTSYSDSGLSASTQYCYRLRSRDSVGNTGSYSAASCATTQAGSGCGSGQPYTNFVGAGNSQDVVATASSNDGAANATQTVNGSGLSGNTHDDEWGNTWTSDGDNGNPNAPNPNPARGNTNWISYDLGHLYKLGQMQVWNGSEISARGLNSVFVDYSADGTNWTQIASANWPQSPGTNNGFNGPDFGGVCVRYVVITINSNHGDGFGNQLAEVKFNIVP